MARVQVSPGPATCSEYGKGSVSKGIPAYREKNVARQVKATADHCGWRELRLSVEDGALPSPGL